MTYIVSSGALNSIHSRPKKYGEHNTGRPLYCEKSGGHLPQSQSTHGSMPMQLTNAVLLTNTSSVT